jgi:hypothetical protein
VDLKLDVGETGIDYTEVAKKEHLSDLEVEVGHLLLAYTIDASRTRTALLRRYAASTISSKI